MNPDKPQVLFTKPQAADHLRVSLRVLEAMMHDGTGPRLKIHCPKGRPGPSPGASTNSLRGIWQQALWWSGYKAGTRRSRRVHLQAQGLPHQVSRPRRLVFWAEAHTVGKSAEPADPPTEKPPKG